MAKTVTVRLDDDVYKLIKRAADGERRTISNFMEYAALAYLTNDIVVSDDEMNEILNDEKCMAGLESGLSDIKKGKYKVVG